jgi:hypothetical protein
MIMKVNNERGKSEFYETFDSGDGPTVPDSHRSEMDHKDAGKGLTNYTSNKADKNQMNVPEMPSKKR